MLSCSIAVGVCVCVYGYMCVIVSRCTYLRERVFVFVFVCVCSEGLLIEARPRELRWRYCCHERGKTSGWEGAGWPGGEV